MEQTAHFCRFCGSTLPNDRKFCENCGAPVTPLSPPHVDQFVPDQKDRLILTSKASGPAPRIASLPLPTPVPQKPSSKSARTKKPNTCLVILGMIGFVLICLSMVFVAENYLGSSQIDALIDSFIGNREIPIENMQAPDIAATGAAPTEPLTVEPSPTSIIHYYNYMPLIIAEVEDHPIDGTPYPAVEQSPVEPTRYTEITENMIFDDFSSPNLEWAQSFSDIADYDYALDAYYIHVKLPSYISWSEIPVDFTPYEIEFDTITPQDNSGGSFGVMCHIQDEANYYIVEIDLSNQVFSIATVVNDELIPLTNPEWATLAGINTTEGSINHFAISCYPDQITLSANNVKVGESDFTGITPFSNPGKMALFVATWDNVSEEGYRVYFDNVSAWMP